MKKFKVENLCIFKVKYISREESGETVISFRMKKIKNVISILTMVKKIFPNYHIISVKPQNKRAKRLIKNAQTRIKLKKNTTKSVVGWSFNYTMPGMSSTSTNYYYSS